MITEWSEPEVLVTVTAVHPPDGTIAVLEGVRHDTGQGCIVACEPRAAFALRAGLEAGESPVASAPSWAILRSWGSDER